MTNAELFKKVFGIYAEEFWAYPEEKMLAWLTSDAPTEDVRENIHAHWEDWSFLGWDMETHWQRRCSNCLCEREDDNEEKDTPFCPNCGAVMNEEEPETTEEDWYKDEWRDEWDERKEDD